MRVNKSLPVLILAGCMAETEAVETASTDQAVTSDNGVSLNGVSLNGVSLNGTDFIGAHFNASLSNGATLELRIDDIDPLADSNDDVLAYAISANADGGWSSLCGYETDGSARRALAVAGT